jgi:hypothetical protein
MGLLDDAIRQHLELKRTRGADPSEVLRQEREALGASGRPEGAEAGAQVVAREEPANDADPAGGFVDAVETAHAVEDSFVEEGVGDAERVEDGGPVPAGVEEGAQDTSAAPTAESEDDALVVRDPGRIALEQETAEVDMGAMLGVDREQDEVEPIEERLKFEQEFPDADDDEDEPWGTPPEPTGV